MLCIFSQRILCQDVHDLIVTLVVHIPREKKVISKMISQIIYNMYICVIVTNPKRTQMDGLYIVIVIPMSMKLGTSGTRTHSNPIPNAITPVTTAAI